MTKTIFITGATSGFGEACARKFADGGYRLVISGRRAERLAVLRSELESKTMVYSVVLDVQDEVAVRQAIETLPTEFAAIDVLLNNAGLALGLGTAPESEMSDWEQMIDTNIKGVLYCTHAVLPGMLARNCGHIINIGSTAAHYPYRGGNVYGGTKAFIAQFSKNLRTDLLGSRIRVTNIEPGLAETEFSLVRFKGDTSKAAQPYQDKQPLKAEDIADLVWYVSQLPAHVNVNSIEVMPTCQAGAGLKTEVLR